MAERQIARTELVKSTLRTGAVVVAATIVGAIVIARDLGKVTAIGVNMEKSPKIVELYGERKIIDNEIAILQQQLTVLQRKESDVDVKVNNIFTSATQPSESLLIKHTIEAGVAMLIVGLVWVKYESGRLRKILKSRKQVPQAEIG